MINSNKIKGRIRELGYTQESCATILGISTPTMNQKINNTRHMTLDEADKLSRFLKISNDVFSIYFFYSPVA